MKFLHTHSWQHNFQPEAESRLCFRAGDEGPSKSTPPPKEAAPYLAEHAYHDFAEYVHGLWHDTLGTKERNDEVLEKLTDDLQWTRIFRHEPGLLSAVPDWNRFNTSSELQGPQLELLKKLQPIERQQIYMKLIDKFIPVKEQIKLDIAGHNRAPEERFAKIELQISKINTIFGAMYGEKDWNKEYTISSSDNEQETKKKQAAEKDAESIARASLTEMYKNPNMRYPDYVNGRMQDDIAAAMKYEPTSSVDAVGTNPKILSDKLSASFARGALNLGVIDTPELKRIRKDLEAQSLETIHTKHTVATNLNTMTDALRLQQRIETKGIYDTIVSMGGWEKLLLFGGSLYLLTRKNAVGSVSRLAAMGLAGFYLFQRIIMKSDDPKKSWDALGDAVKWPFNEANKRFFPDASGSPLNDGLLKIDPDAAVYKAKIMVDFLDDFEQRNLEAMATGFGLLSRIPLSMLAQHFVPGKNAAGQDDLSSWGLDFESPTMDAAMTKAMKDSKWKMSAYRLFFSNQDNVKQVNDALGYTFFALAAEQPQFAEKTNLVKEVRAEIAREGRISRLKDDWYNYQSPRPAFNRKIRAAHEAFKFLVWQGRDIAIGSTQTLQDFVESTIHRTPPPIPEHIAEGHGTDSDKKKTEGVEADKRLATELESDKREASSIDPDKRDASTIDAEKKDPSSLEPSPKSATDADVTRRASGDRDSDGRGDLGREPPARRIPSADE